jgi:hypothetical protein
MFVSFPRSSERAARSFDSMRIPIRESDISIRIPQRSPPRRKESRSSNRLSPAADLSVITGRDQLVGRYRQPLACNAWIPRIAYVPKIITLLDNPANGGDLQARRTWPRFVRGSSGSSPLLSADSAADNPSRHAKRDAESTLPSPPGAGRPVAPRDLSIPGESTRGRGRGARTIDAFACLRISPSGFLGPDFLPRSADSFPRTIRERATSGPG